MEEKIVNKDALDANKQWFLEYAQEVLQNRALPDAEDGLIVAQRQLLWVISKIVKMKPTDKFKKSASLVGSTMATAYVHGDAALYDVLRNLALPFVMRYPLIEPHGSMGTQESSDLFAASRYTEARPSLLVPLMMNDYEKKVVDTHLTYTNEDYEPTTLPGLLPNAIVNGHYGIGVSMASSTLPHNLGEVCDAIIKYIDKKGDISVNDILEVLPGPDFPTGGKVINQKDVKTAFETGRSSITLKIQGDYVVEGNQIIFSSIPYRSYRADIRKQLAKKVEDVEKYFDDFNDYSQVGRTKIVFKIKKGVEVEDALAFLFQNTSLQNTVSYNNNFVYHGTPKLCSMKDLIQIYVDHQRDVKRRAAIYDEEKAEKKAHILEGLLKVIGDIDNAIKIIREAENKSVASVKLRDFFKIDDEQVKAVLDLKLSRLTKLDTGETKKELAENYAIIEDCLRILEDDDYRDSLVKKDIIKMKSLSDRRRTILTDENQKKIILKKDNKIVNEIKEVYFFEGGIIKVGDIKNIKIKPKQNIKVGAEDYIGIFSSDGTCYKIKGSKIKKTSSNIYELCDMDRNAAIFSCVLLNGEGTVTSITKKGYMKRSNLSEYSSSRSVSISKINDGDSLVNVLINAKNITLQTSDGKGLSYSLDCLSELGRNTRGVKAISLSEGEEIISAKDILTPSIQGNRATKGIKKK